LTFMSPARDQFARTTTRFCTRSLLSLWPKRLPAEAEESALTTIPRRPPTIRQSDYIGKEQNDAASVTSAVPSHSFDNDSSIDIVGERRSASVRCSRCPAERRNTIIEAGDGKTLKALSRLSPLASCGWVLFYVRCQRFRGAAYSFFLLILWLNLLLPDC